MARQGAALPPLLELAAHPMRWAILNELGHSDLRVRELTAVLDQRQSLVSYHLGRLRSEGIVSTRRSSFDGRDTYYRVDLARCRELLSQTGGALHPALRLAAPPAPEPATKSRVLFLCTGNSGRSQMAEALLRDIAPDRAAAFSAGSHPKPVHPDAIRTLGERGIDISSAKSKHLSVFASERFDHVVSLCDRVREVCPEFPGSPATAHWSVPDPAREPDGAAAFARVADELTARIGFFLHVLALRPTTPGVN
jgi:ArsR family transcriptional regulator, arsenate/arsenite/antimonite-responsive transcriptional repressor / arsenate reductase (thioredoxin)